MQCPLPVASRRPRLRADVAPELSLARYSISRHVAIATRCPIGSTSFSPSRSLLFHEVPSKIAFHALPSSKYSKFFVPSRRKVLRAKLSSKLRLHFQVHAIGSTAFSLSYIEPAAASVSPDSLFSVRTSSRRLCFSFFLADLSPSPPTVGAYILGLFTERILHQGIPGDRLNIMRAATRPVVLGY